MLNAIPVCSQIIFCLKLRRKLPITLLNICYSCKSRKLTTTLTTKNYENCPIPAPINLMRNIPSPIGEKVPVRADGGSTNIFCQILFSTFFLFWQIKICYRTFKCLCSLSNSFRKCRMWVYCQGNIFNITTHFNSQ